VYCQTKVLLPSSVTSNVTSDLNCFVMKGTMQILAHPTSTVSLAIDAIQNELQNVVTIASQKDPTVTGVTVLSYLGNSADEAAIFLADLTNKNDNDFGPIVAVTNESPSEGKSPVGFVFAVGIPLCLALLGSIFLIKRRSRMINGVNAFQSWEDYDPTTNVLKGTGDPPDSYHDGLYHYMHHGRQKYLSTRCALCLETKRNISSAMYTAALKCPTSTSTFGNIIPKQYPNSKDEEYEDDEANQIAQARSDMRLGQYHMGIDVHVCQSATCIRCSNVVNHEPTFVPTGIVRYTRKDEEQDSNNEDDDDNSSLSSSQTPTSGNSTDDNQSFETKSTYQRNICTPVPQSPPKRGGQRRWYGSQGNM
jgi:hypothetical protein